MNALYLILAFVIYPFIGFLVVFSIYFINIKMLGSTPFYDIVDFKRHVLIWPLFLIFSLTGVFIFVVGNVIIAIIEAVDLMKKIK